MAKNLVGRITQVLGAVKTFTESSWRRKETENDVTTLALVRAARQFRRRYLSRVDRGKCLRLFNSPQWAGGITVS